MKEELKLISDIYKRINISELAPRDSIKGHLRDARRMLNDLTVKLSQHDVMAELPFTSDCCNAKAEAIHVCTKCHNWCVGN